VRSKRRTKCSVPNAPLISSSSIFRKSKFAIWLWCAKIDAFLASQTDETSIVVVISSSGVPMVPASSSMVGCSTPAWRCISAKAFMSDSGKAIS